MSQRIMLTVPGALYAKMLERKGTRTDQAFILDAIDQACSGSAVEAELRRQLDQLHETIRAIGGRAGLAANPSPNPAPVPDAEPGEGAGPKLGW